MGDVIIATSCLEPIRQQRPGEPVVFVARAAMRPLLEHHPLLDGFIALPAPDDAHPVATLAAQLRAAGGADAAWLQLHPDPLTQAAAQLARIPRRIGYRRGFFADRTLTDRLPDRRRAGARHEAEHNFDVLTPLDIRAPKLDQLRARVHLPESWRQSLRLRLAAAGFDDFDDDGGDYAVLNPTAHSLDHRWPAENWAWLAHELRDRGFERVFLVGESADDPSARRIRHLLGPGIPGVVDLSGQTNLAELGWLLRAARVFVSRNTGSTHLAAAVGCPTVELFGRLQPIYGPTRWRALGERTASVLTAAGPRRWFETQRTFWRRGYDAIAREAVLTATLELARTRPNGASHAESAAASAHMISRFLRHFLTLLLLSLPAAAPVLAQSPAGTAAPSAAAVISPPGGGTITTATPPPAPLPPGVAATVEHERRLVRDIKANTENIKSRGTFGAQLWLIANGDFFMNWRKPDPPTISPISIAVRGQPVYTPVIFYGEARDDKGLANVSYDLTIRRPDGSVYSESKGLVGFQNLGPSDERVLQLGRGSLTITLTADDPAGLYTVEALVHDNVGRVDLPLVQHFLVQAP